MNSTTHYSLRKPAADDRVLLADFDHNWDAIDTAIHGAAASAEAAQAAVDSEVTARQNAISAETTARQSAITTLENKIGWQLLKSTSTVISNSYLTLSLSDIDWSKYSRVHARIAATSTTAYGTMGFTLYPFSNIAVSGWVMKGAVYWLTLYPMYEAQTQVTGTYTNGSTWKNADYSTAKTFAELTELRVVRSQENNPMGSGSLILYGEP